MTRDINDEIIRRERDASSLTFPRSSLEIRLARHFFLNADENGISSTSVEYVSSNREHDKFEKWSEFA